MERRRRHLALVDAGGGGDDGGGITGGAVSQFRAVGARHRIWAEVGPCCWVAWLQMNSRMKPAADKEESGCRTKMAAEAKRERHPDGLAGG